MGAKTPGRAQIVVLSVTYTLFVLVTLFVHAQYAFPDAERLAQITKTGAAQIVQNVFKPEDLASLRAVTRDALERVRNAKVEDLPLAQFQDSIRRLVSNALVSVDVGTQKQILVSNVQSTIFDAAADYREQVDIDKVQQVLVEAIDATVQDPAAAQ